MKSTVLGVNEIFGESISNIGVFSSFSKRKTLSNHSPPSTLYHTFVNKSRHILAYHPPENEYISLSGEYIIKRRKDARWRVMRYSPIGADDMHHASRGDDIPSLRLG